MLNNIEAEMAVIGSVMLCNNCFDDVAEILQASDFYSTLNVKIWQRLSDLSNAGKPIDLITVTDGTDIPMGELASIARDTPSAKNAVVYAQAVKVKSEERRLHFAGSQISKIAIGPGDIEEKVSRASQLLEVDEPTKDSDINGALKTIIDQIDEKHQNQGKIFGLETGIKKLDYRLNGLKPGRVWVIAGRPAMGKTTLAMNVAEHNAVILRKPMLVISLEMMREEIVQRCIASIGGIDQEKIERGQISGDDWSKLSAACSRLKDAPLFIEDCQVSTLDQIQFKVRSYKKKHPDLAGVVIDYLQLIRCDKNSKTESVTHISETLKTMAKNFKLPFIVLSQLNRKCEERSNKRPTLSDLRDSGAIEQDADIITFLYRDEVYNPDTMDKGICELITAKFRGGKIGVDFVQEQLKYSRFIDIPHNN